MQNLPITKEELLQIRDTINELIDYSSAEKKKKSKKLNNYFIIGLICFLVIFDKQFDLLSYIFQENVGELVAGALTSLGLLFEFIGLYNNNNDISLAEKKKSFLGKIT